MTGLEFFGSIYKLRFALRSAKAGLSKLAYARMSLRDMDALKGIPTCEECEVEFISRIQHTMNLPGRCRINSLRNAPVSAYNHSQ
jgi:hypothetical protein